MGIRRSALSFDERYTQVPNDWARDERLSRRARGLLVEIMSHRVGWHVTIRSLAKTGPEGRDAIQSAVTELLEHGYVRRTQGRGASGTFGEIEYELCEPPTASGFSVHGSTVSGSTGHGESATKKNISSEDHPSEHEDVVLLSEPAASDPVEDAFEVVWNLWPSPRRSTRKKALPAFKAAVKAAGGVRGISTVVDGVRRDVAVWRTWPAADVQFVPLLTTWLNGERWTGAAPLPRAGGSSGPSPMERAQSVLDMGRALDGGARREVAS